MNRRIFSLVCIALYALLDASIYCSQQKESDARNKNVRGTKEINRSNDEYDKESSCFNIPKRDKKSKRIIEKLYSEVPSDLSSDEMIKIFLNDHKDLPMNDFEFDEYIMNIFKNDPKQTAFLLKLYIKLSNRNASDYFNKFSKFKYEYNNYL
ncbi:fam-c protein [Plasmodium vinckei brucechwatti]|uniref:Fam-c protein n=1 Tax=Plasmodium vinckei brucechwatti TaxID=119398 RepID=A0A6V7S9F5_PLAVN|nr:fam-c protein [Plasmodium vinckei brucechwatti]